MAFSYSYWEGIPNSGYGSMQIEFDRVLNRVPVEDGLHMLIAIGTPELTRGTQRERERKHLELLRTFPETIDPDLLDEARMVTEVAVAPESLMRGSSGNRPVQAGLCSAMPATSSTRGPHRGSATPSSRPSTSPTPSPDRSPASIATRSGAMHVPPSNTSGRSPGAISRGRAPASTCFGDGRPSPTPDRTCATPSAARSSPRS